MNTKYINSFIPISLLNDNNLTSLEKLIMIHIISLCKHREYCWASNQYFCNIYKVSRQTISKSINNLARNGYLENDYIKTNINHDKRKISLSTAFKNEIKGIQDSINTGIK